MYDVAFQIALANLAVALIPGQALAMVATGIDAAGMLGGLRVMAGITAAKLVWAAAALGLLPLTLAAGPVLLDTLRIAGGLFLAGFGLLRLVQGSRPEAGPRAGHGTVRVAFAASLASPITTVFFLSAFPAMAAPLPTTGPEATALLLVAVALSSLLALLPWLGLGLAARRLGQRTLRLVSGGFMIAAGATLAASAF